MTESPNTPDQTPPPALLDCVPPTDDTLSIVLESDRPKYSRLGPEEVAEILRLRRLNPDVTQAEIAAVIGCSPSAVSYWLSGFVDTTEDARNVLQADALDAALELGSLMRRSKHDKIRLDASKANLQANKLLGNEDARVSVGVQVVLGVPSSWAPQPGE